MCRRANTLFQTRWDFKFVGTLSEALRLKCWMSGLPSLFAPSGEAVVKTTLADVIQRGLAGAGGPAGGKRTVAVLVDSSYVLHTILHGPGTGRALPLKVLWLLAHASTPESIAILDTLYVRACC